MNFTAVDRTPVDYEKTYGRFVLRNTNYSMQYNTLYIGRLAETMVNLRKEAAAKWGSSVSILDKIIDSESRAIGNEEVVLVGTIIKTLKLRGSVLNEFQSNMGISGGIQSLENISSSRDSLIIEDESGRAALGGAILPHVQYLVGGIAIAVKGTVVNGVFVVSEWTFAHQISPVSEGPTPAISASRQKTDKYLALVSGIQVGSESNSGSMELSQQMLTDFLSGRMGDEDDVQLASQIVKVIVAGNSVKSVDSAAAKERYSSSKTLVKSATPTKQFDVLLSQVVTSCPVDVMPGATDISTVAMPQQPLHTSLFPHCSRFNSFSRTPNPYEAKFDKLLVCGTSGQPIIDIARQTVRDADVVLEIDPNASANKDAYVPIVYTEDDNDGEAMVVETDAAAAAAEEEGDKLLLQQSNTCLDVLTNTLRWGHLCPTVPDTLAGYTFQDKDPMIIKEVPSVYFAGNQPKFLTSLVNVDHDHDGENHSSHFSKKCRIVCIPEFKNNPSLVLVNLSRDDLECTVVTFKQDAQ